MEWFLAFSAVFCSWALLRALGGERSRRLADLEKAGASTDAPSPPSNPPQPRKA